MGGRINEWRTERSLSTARAGASGRAFASERLWSFVRHNAVRLALTSLILVSFGTLVMLLPTRFDSVKGFAIGGWTVFVLMYAYHWCMIASRAAQSMMGEQGEVWTDQELRSLRKRGWRVVNHLTLKQGDIDHVAIGPDGLMVIESKWTSGEMKLDGTDRWLQGWADQAKRNTDDVRRLIGWGARVEAPIAPLVVVWGPQVRPTNIDFHQMSNGVKVVAGEHLGDLLGDLAHERTGSEEIERAYRKLADHARRRDAKDLEVAGPRPPTPRQILDGASLMLLIAVIAFYASVSALRLPPWTWPVSALTIIAAGLGTARREGLRRFGTAWLVGFAVALVLLVAVALTKLL